MYIDLIPDVAQDDNKDVFVVFTCITCGLIFVGIVFILMASVFHINSIVSKSVCSAETPGIVVDMKSRKSSSGMSHKGISRTVYAPVVQFHVYGKTHTVVSSIYSYPPKYEIGDDITVHYNPDDPEEVYFDSPESLAILPLIFGIIGVLLVVASVPVGIFTFKMRPRKSMYAAR